MPEENPLYSVEQLEAETRASVRATLSALALAVRWQGLLEQYQRIPGQTLAAVLDPLIGTVINLARLIGQAEEAGLITADEAACLRAGRAIGHWDQLASEHIGTA